MRQPLSLSDAAESYVDALISVFPCHSFDGICSCGRETCKSPGKHPRVKNGVLAASDDPLQVRAWWGQWPGANIGIATGKPSGMWVLDLDGDAGIDSLHTLEDANAVLPATWTVRTGGGGLHYYFALSVGEDIGNSSNRVAHKIDVRGTGGYVIAPPSSHKSGNHYAWAKDRGPGDVELARAPLWLIDLATRQREAPTDTPERPLQPSRPRPRAEAVDRAQRYLAKMPPAISGSGGHGATFDAACVLVKGFALDEATAYDLLANDYNPRCQPPWTEKALWHKIRSAAADGRRPEGYLLEASAPPSRQKRSSGGERQRLAKREASSPVPPQHGEAQAPPPEPIADAASDDAPDGLPAILLGGRQDRDVLRDAWSAVVEANEPPVFYVTHHQLSVLLRDPSGKLAPSPASEALLRKRLTDVADWFRNTQSGWSPTSHPRIYAQMMLAEPHQQIPPLDGVVYTPVFDRHGALLSAPGYHAKAALYLDTDLELDVPEQPTVEDETRARRLLVDELLGDFPFADDASRAHALGALVLPFVRRMIAGPTPLHMVGSSTPGTGKSLLAQAIAVVATGVEAQPTTLPSRQSDDEVRKKITSTLLAKPVMILWDNLQSLTADSLAAVITSEWWADRLLGATQTVQLRNSALWIATANNPEMSSDMSRRCCPISIDAETERPELRRGFKHDPLLSWVHRARHELVWAVLTLVRLWMAAGRPVGERRIGSFESWSEVVGGIVRLWYPGAFMSNFEQVRSDSDHETNVWRDVFDRWWDHWRDEGVRPVQLCRDEVASELLIGLLGDTGSLATKVGRRLRKLRGRVIGGLRVSSRPGRANASLYSLEKVDEVKS